MKRLVNALLVAAASIGIDNAFAASHDPAVIIPLMPSSRLSLVEGIRLAEKSHGPATSAKFEVAEGGKLVLSVYTIPEGFGVEPEKATLSEVAIDPTMASPDLALEIFEDKEHIARAASHMTLFRLSKLSLVQVIENAARATGATPIDVRNPTVIGKRPAAEVMLFDKQRKPLTVIVDLLSGRVRRTK